jgi:hypothetical protein
MMEFTLEQKKLIYSAVRYYQMNRVPHAGKEYGVCDDILNGMFDDVKMNAQPPTPPVNGFGFNV